MFKVFKKIQEANYYNIFTSVAVLVATVKAMLIHGPIFYLKIANVTDKSETKITSVNRLQLIHVV